MVKRWLVLLLIALVVCLIALEFSGYYLEEKVRNFYRSSICHCDTLRAGFRKDDRGVWQVNYYHTSGENLSGWLYNPLEVSQKALVGWQEKNDTQAVEAASRWLLSNAVVDQEEKYMLWKHNYPWLPYEKPSGWVSAMTQGFAIKLFVVAEQNEILHIDSALFKKMIAAYYLTEEKGGFVYALEPDCKWYKEYGHVSGKEPFVLNGMMHALLGLKTYLEYHPQDQFARDAFEEGICGLLQMLKMFDRANGSYYDALGLNASHHYHQIHIQQLGELHTFTKHDALKEMKEKWQKSSRRFYLADRLTHPNLSFLFLAGIVGLISLLVELIALKFIRGKK